MEHAGTVPWNTVSVFRARHPRSDPCKGEARRSTLRHGLFSPADSTTGGESEILCFDSTYSVLQAVIHAIVRFKST